jgi:hypothetical protein
MSTTPRWQQFIRSTIAVPQKIIRYLAEATIRIFSPSDDQYPKTGVQPFEGDPAKKEH